MWPLCNIKLISDFSSLNSIFKIQFLNLYLNKIQILLEYKHKLHFENTDILTIGKRLFVLCRLCKLGFGFRSMTIMMLDNFVDMC